MEKKNIRKNILKIMLFVLIVFSMVFIAMAFVSADDYPYYSSLANNASTTTLRLNSVKWTIELFDDTALDSYIFSFNDSGSWVNDSVISLSASSFPSGSILFWTLNETSGTTATDMAGNFDGTINSGVTINKDGKFNNSYLFTNTGNNTIEAGDVNWTDNMTINFWINKSTSQTGEFVFNKYTAGYEDGLYIDNAINAFCLFPSCDAFNSSSIYDVGIWTMITLRKTGTNWEIFKNGIAIQNITHSSGTAQTNFRLGNRGTGGDAFGLSAYLDEFGIWNTDLTNAEITALLTTSYSTGLTNVLDINISATKTINATAGNEVCGTFYFNDSVNQENQSLNSCFIVAYPSLPQIYVTSPVTTTYNVSTITIDFSASPNIDSLWYNNGTDNISFPITTLNSYDWNQYRHFLNNTGFTDSPAPNNLSVYAKFIVNGFSYSSCSIANGFAYCGSADGYLYQLNASNISKLVNKLYMGNAIGTDSTAYCDINYCYIGSYNYSFFQVNASNITIVIATYTTGNQNVISSPKLYNGSMFGGSYDGYFYQLNATNISKLINKFYSDSMDSSATILPYSNTIIYGDRGGFYHQLNLSNISQEIARFNISDGASSVVAFLSASCTDEYCYFGSANAYVVSGNYTMYQVNASNITQKFSQFDVTMPIDSSPALSQDLKSLYFCGYDHFFYQLNASDISQLINKLDLGGECDASPVATKDYVFIGSSTNNTFYELNASNITILIDKFSISGAVYGFFSSPAIANGFIYQATYDNKTIYQFGSPIMTTNPVNITLNDGNYNFTFYANDTSGNENHTSVNFTITTLIPDTTPPNITIYSPTMSCYDISSILINFTAVDDIAVDKMWYWNSTKNVSYSSENTITLADGTYTLNFYANDTSNNENHTSVMFMIDTLFPAINFITPTPPNNHYQTSNSVYVNVSSSDANDFYTIMDWNRSLIGWWNFENGLIDNSSYGNNGTCTTCPNTTSRSCGYAKIFDGYNTAIEISNSSSIKSLQNKFTIEFWANVTDSNTYRGIISKTNGGYPQPFDIYVVSGTTDMRFFVGNGSSNQFIQIPGVVFNTWQYWTLIYNGTHIYAYMNGNMVYAPDAVSVPVYNNGEPLRIGNRNDGITPMNGSLDEIQIYNRVLTPQEINASYSQSYQYYNNFTNLQDGIYTYQAFATDADGNLNQTGLRTLTIDNTAPYYTNYASNGIYPKINDSVNWSVTLTDNINIDSFIFSTNNTGVWTNNSAVIVSGTIVNVSAVITMIQPRGTQVCGVFYFNDTLNNMNETPVFCIIMGNTPPTPPLDFNLTPSLVYVNSNLTAENITGSYDADGDPITYYYQFYDINTSAIKQDYSLIAYFILPNSSSHDFIEVRTKAYDGFDYSGILGKNKTIGNTIPVTSVPTLNETTAYKTNSAISCLNSSTNDTDNDPIIYFYQWFVNNLANVTIQNITNSSFNHFDNLTCEIRASDSYSNSTPMNSTILTINNSIPSTPDIVLSPNPILVLQTLNVTASNSTDNDGDTITYYYQFYNVNASAIRQNYSTNNTYDTQTMDTFNIIRTRVYATDIYSNSTITEQNITIGSLYPTSTGGSSSGVPPPFTGFTIAPLTAGGLSYMDYLLIAAVIGIILFLILYKRKRR